MDVLKYPERCVPRLLRLDASRPPGTSRRGRSIRSTSISSPAPYRAAPESRRRRPWRIAWGGRHELARRVGTVPEPPFRSAAQAPRCGTVDLRAQVTREPHRQNALPDSRARSVRAGSRALADHRFPVHYCEGGLTRIQPVLCPRTALRSLEALAFSDETSPPRVLFRLSSCNSRGEALRHRPSSLPSRRRR